MENFYSRVMSCDTLHLTKHTPRPPRSSLISHLPQHHNVTSNQPPACPCRASSKPPIILRVFSICRPHILNMKESITVESHTLSFPMPPAAAIELNRSQSVPPSLPPHICYVNTDTFLLLAFPFHSIPFLN